jgi:hypothetical protein
MCAACAHAPRDCSGLPFETMQMIDWDADKTRVVRCSEYLRVDPVGAAPAQPGNTTASR